MARTPKPVIHDWTEDEKALHSRTNDLRSLAYSMEVARARALEMRVDRKSLQQIPRYPGAPAEVERLKSLLEKAQADVDELTSKVKGN